MHPSTQLLEEITIRVLNPGKNTAGAGFLLSDSVAVTCAHVIHAARSDKGKNVEIEYYKSGRRTASLVSADHWSDPDKDDVAFLFLSQKAKPIVLPFLHLSEDIIGNPFSCLGFPNLSDRKAHFAQGNLGWLVPTEAPARKPILQMDGKDIEEGMSGSAVLDLNTGYIVGMISEYLSVGANTKYAYATTAKTLLGIYPLTRDGKLAELHPFAADLQSVQQTLISISDEEVQGTDTLDLLHASIKQFSSTQKEIRNILGIHVNHPSKILIESSLEAVHIHLEELEKHLIPFLLSEQEENHLLVRVNSILDILDNKLAHLIDTLA